MNQRPVSKLYKLGIVGCTSHGVNIGAAPVTINQLKDEGLRVANATPGLFVLVKVRKDLSSDATSFPTLDDLNVAYGSSLDGITEITYVAAFQRDPSTGTSGPLQVVNEGSSLGTVPIEASPPQVRDKTRQNLLVGLGIAATGLAVATLGKRR